MSEKLRARRHGLVVDQVDKLLARVRRKWTTDCYRLHRWRWRKTAVVFQAAYGNARDDSLTCIFSATKGLPQQQRGC